MAYSARIEIDTNAGDVAKIYEAFRADLGKMDFAKNAMTQAEKDVRRYSLDAWTRHWHNKPTFRTAVSTGSGRANLSIWLVPNKAGQHFKWVDQGTAKTFKPSYIITSSNALERENGKGGPVIMRFREKYNAATRPSGIGGPVAISGQPWSKTGKWTQTRLVYQGIEPRNMLVQAQDYANRKFVLWLARELAQAAQKRGIDWTPVANMIEMRYLKPGQIQDWV